MEELERYPAIAAAVERGKAAGKSGRFEPVSVDHPGWLTARVKDTRSGEVEGVYIQGSQLIYSRVGRTAGGEIVCHTVRHKELRRVVRAMIEDPEPELVREAVALRREKRAPAGTGRRVRRGST